MSKYTEAETKIKKIMCEEIDRLPSHFDGEDEVYDSVKDVDEILKLNKTICKALNIADRLEQAESELKDEYNSMNDWYINKFDIFQDHTECEKIALDFTLSTMQTISYLLDSLADIRGDTDE